MERPFKFAFSLFAGRYEKFLFLISLIQIPCIIIHLLVTNYIYAITPFTGTMYSVADIYYALITILMFLYVQIPFVKYTYNEFTGHEKPLKDSFYHFLIQGFNIFVFSCVLSIVTVIGFMLLVIPGVVILSLFITAPIIAIIDNKSVWKSLKESILIFKKNWMKIISYIVVIGLLELIVGIILNYVILNITQSYAAIIITQIFLNTLFYPFFIVLLTSSTIKWRESLNLLKVNEHDAVI